MVSIEILFLKLLFCFDILKQLIIFYSTFFLKLLKYLLTTNPRNDGIKYFLYLFFSYIFFINTGIIILTIIFAIIKIYILQKENTIPEVTVITLKKKFFLNIRTNDLFKIKSV